jgi:DEAD/DEAH box helicase domain-containing protein
MDFALVQGSSKLSTKLDEIYNTWFSRRPEAARLYAAQSIRRPHVEGVRTSVRLRSLRQCAAGQGGVSGLRHQELLPVSG